VRARTADWLVLATLAAVALAADQITKALVRSTLDVGEESAVGPVAVHHVRNSGILGGHFQGSGLVVGALTTLVVAGILVAFARHGGTKRLYPVAFGLLVGGSVGNLIDRLRLGYVTDFIARDAEKAANLADVAIVVALVFLVVSWLLPSRSRRRPGARPAETEAP
jgi:signal peptidase II